MYIFYTKKLWGLPRPIAKLLLIMRLTTFILTVTILQVTASGYGQKITLSENNAPLVKIFNQIRKQANVDFVVTNGMLTNASPVTVHVKNMELKQVLEKIFEGQPLNYAVENKFVVVSSKENTMLDNTANALFRFFQANDVGGRVIAADGSPLGGATITLKGANRSVRTNPNGEFRLTNAGDKPVLLISYLGYKNQEVPVGRNRENILITLEAEISKLDEVAVQGYGVRSQRTATGNLAKMSSEEIAKQPVLNVMEGLAGRIAGMVVNQTTGVPGARLNIQIRGRANFDRNLTSDQPLFILDGVPIAAGNERVNLVSGPFGAGTADGLSAIAGINPTDIESIDVLKDADATAIYGSRGANGVILITTKKGKAGKMSLNADVISGVSVVSQMPKMMNTEQYISMRNEAFANDKLTKTNANAYDLLLWDNNRYTDFADLLVGNAATNLDAKATFSGGSKYSTYRFGGSYRKDNTVWPGDMYTDRFTLNANLHNMSQNEKFTLDFSAIYGTNKSNLTALDLASAVVLPPNFRLYNEDGSLAWNEGNFYVAKDNPLAVLNQEYRSVMNNLNASMVLNYKLLKNLTIRTNMGYNYTLNDEKRITPLTARNPLTPSNLTAFAGFGVNQLKNWIVEPQVEYTGYLKKGKLNVLLGATYNQRSNAGQVINATGFTSDELLESLKGAAATGLTVNITGTPYKYQAFFGRLNYNLDNKYIVNLTGRRDGSSRFGPSYRFSNFGAAGAAWLFSNENILKDNKLLSYGKLRASYGSTGNDQIGEYQYLDAWTSPGNYADSAALYPTKLFNPDLHWEKNNKFEIGLELGFLKDRILFTASAYQNISSEPLVTYPLPKTTGQTSIVRNLDGVAVRNRGLELTLTTQNIKNDNFVWTTDFNMTIPENKLLRYPGLASSSYATSYAIGESLNRIVVGQYTGVDPTTGLYTVKDVNGDNLSNSAFDWTAMGNSDPDFFGGINNSFRYKRFTASFFIHFTKQLGRDWRTQNLTNPPGTIFNQPVLALDRWQYAGQVTDVQKFTTQLGAISGTSGFYSMYFSSRGYTDASFLRLRNAYLSYDLPAGWLSRVHINSLKVFVQGQNLFVITGYKGADPETQSYTRMAPLRAVTGGLQLSL